MKITSYRFVVIALCSLPLFGQTPTTHKKHTGAASPVPSVLTQPVDSAALEQKLAQWKAVKMPFDASSLTDRERRMVEKLVEASHYLEDIFLRQSDPEVVALIQSLEQSKTPKDKEVLRMLRIQGSRYDLLAENRPFLGTQPMSPDRGFYPTGLTREEIEQYAKDHPEKKEEIYSGTTIVRRNGDQLEGVAYHVAYRQFLEPAARALREAASMSDDAAFANFLRLRADALLSDDYYPSDLVWVDLKDPKIDVIFAPYETYTDDVLGVKGSYGVSVLIRDTEQSKKLAVFQKYVPDIQDALPLEAASCQWRSRSCSATRRHRPPAKATWRM
jgi:hypothetical protein